MSHDDDPRPDHLDDARAAIVARMRLPHPLDRSELADVRGLLWVLAEGIERDPERRDVARAVREAGDVLTGEQGAAAKHERWFGTALPGDTPGDPHRR